VRVVARRAAVEVVAVAERVIDVPVLERLDNPDRGDGSDVRSLRVVVVGHKSQLAVLRDLDAPRSA
jgi:hypothetical protein